jgi:hypothetical protein
MMRSLMALLSSALLLSLSALADDIEPTNPELRTELLAMMELDQEVRRAGGAERMLEVDTRHATRLREMLEERDWPRISEVGRDGAQAAWLLVQHADHDVELQKQVLDLLYRYLETDEANPRDVAYLDDRVAVNESRPQKYGTQGRCRDEGGWAPLELSDPDAVEDKRKAVGLPSLKDYVARMQRFCPSPQDDHDEHGE